MFQEALARCERGETGGIVVAKLDRFARSAVDALESIRRLNQAGARLVSVEDGFDGSTPMGRFAIGILTMIAELELERIKESWATAITRAVDRGIHISSRPPTGYMRDKDKRLVARRARRLSGQGGLSPARARSLLGRARRLPRRAGGRDARGNAHWSKTASPGSSRTPPTSGRREAASIVKEDAHEALVTRAEFDAAQSVTKSLLTPRDGSLAEQAMLGGLAALCRLRPHAEDHGQHRPKDGRALPGLLLHRPLCQRAVSRRARPCAPRCSMTTSKRKCSTRSTRRTGFSRRPSMPQRRSKCGPRCC